MIKKIINKFLTQTIYLYGLINYHFFLKKKINIKKYIFTIGAPRSGTTLLGEILNSHPNILISNEVRVLNQIFEKKYNFNKAIKISNINAYNEYLKIKKKNITIQNKWKDLDFNKFFLKKNITISGDKKSGGNSILYKKFEFKFEKFVKDNKNIYFLVIIRNPYDAAKSYLKSHRHETKNIRDAIKQIIERNSYAFKLKKKFSNRVKIIYYENFLSNPQKSMISICRFLKIKTSQKWLNFLNLISNKNISYKINSINKLNYIRKIIDPKHIYYYKKYF